MPLSDGSASASSARSRPSALAGLVAQARGLRAVLEVEERVADAAVGQDVHARADVRAGAALDRALRDHERAATAASTASWRE